MGGAVSAGQNNSELVDNLCYENYIQTPRVEMVFRQIDRADFMIFSDDQDRLEAYEDHAWRFGKLHLSAPCIYTRAMEALNLDKGLSFLNIGSGTGYLSTMAGLLIGPYGINHGIEIYPENIEFAHEKQSEFRDKSPWYDPVSYCEPFFVAGNGLLVSPGNLLYDRIYCGAACPSEHAQLMKNMLAIGGRLVMPHGNQLECVERVSESEWKTEVILPSVSFAPLILPSEESVKDLDPLQLDLEPLPLKQYCRLQILKHLGRKRYGEVSNLPLPHHLKDYVSYYREWGPPQADLKVLCPIDHTKGRPSDMDDRDSGAAEGEGSPSRGRRRHSSGRGRLGGRPSARQLNINGRRMLICNVNGVYFQIPIDSDDDDDDENGNDVMEDDADDETSSTNDNEGDHEANMEDEEEKEEDGEEGEDERRALLNESLEMIENSPDIASVGVVDNVGGSCSTMDDEDLEDNGNNCRKRNSVDGYGEEDQNPEDGYPAGASLTKKKIDP